MQIIQHSIAGRLTDGHGQRRSDVFDPTTGRVTRHVALGSERDVDDAVRAARAAFPAWAATPH